MVVKNELNLKIYNGLKDLHEKSYFVMQIFVIMALLARTLVCTITIVGIYIFLFLIGVERECLSSDFSFK